MFEHRTWFAALTVSLLLLCAGPSSAQDQWTWPDKPTNLQVLPKDWTGKRLAPVMKGFTRALGVRCTHCHVGEEGRPLSTYDFASDANPNKDRAREMYRMLHDINGHLKNITPSGGKRVNMWCNTCHHGRPKPNTLAEELGETYRAKGVDSALAHYAALRTTFYGRGAYDFGEESLSDLADEALEKNDIAGALAILKLNAETFPGSSSAWENLASATLKGGDTKLAQQFCEKALGLDPGNEYAKLLLAKIREAGGK